MPGKECGLLEVHHRRNPSRMQLENELGKSSVLEHNMECGIPREKHSTHGGKVWSERSNKA